ncbi:MAG: GreA/GreB family elongation factor [Candidatus Magasanikbacteria bacterium]|nr:GreA/GreB family elongation factor [Candidatus Magasanikbacteria bacterium]
MCQRNGVGGSKLEDNKDTVFVIGITTPIARKLLLKEVGEVIELSVRSTICEWEILEIK